MPESPIESAPESATSGADLTPAAAPPVPVPAPFEPVASAVSYAGFWFRAAAAVIDFCVLLLLWFATDAVIRISAGVRVAPIWKESSGATIGLNCAENSVELVVWWLYAALSESSAAQATLGKRALRLRVTDTLGRPVSFFRATGRNFGKILSTLTLFIGYGMAGFTRRKQALHDLMAQTVVLKMGAVQAPPSLAVPVRSVPE
ncbi:MAG: RDD family protein [Acidobacteria bacterium]|nr:RDD family protein [Acidobacteriota bacterium]